MTRSKQIRWTSRRVKRRKSIKSLWKWSKEQINMKQNVFEQSSKQEAFSEPSSHENAKYSTWKSTSNEIGERHHFVAFPNLQIETIQPNRTTKTKKSLLNGDSIQMIIRTNLSKWWPFSKKLKLNFLLFFFCWDYTFISLSIVAVEDIRVRVRGEEMWLQMFLQFQSIRL